MIVVMLGAGCPWVGDSDRLALEDRDGDGVVATAWGGADCDDDDATVGAPERFHLDADEDGFGDADRVERACVAPAGFVRIDGDCNDTDPAVHPDAEEVCNQIDDDCDGLTDDADDDAPGTAVWYPDLDGDGHGLPDDAVTACTAPDGYVALDDDCDDADPSRSPSAPEICGDGLDQDCGVWHDLDCDQDGFPDFPDVCLCGAPTLIDIPGDEPSLSEAVRGNCRILRIAPGTYDLDPVLAINDCAVLMASDPDEPPRLQGPRDVVLIRGDATLADLEVVQLGEEDADTLEVNGNSTGWLSNVHVSGGGRALRGDDGAHVRWVGGSITDVQRVSGDVVYITGTDVEFRRVRFEDVQGDSALDIYHPPAVDELLRGTTHVMNVEVSGTFTEDAVKVHGAQAVEVKDSTFPLPSWFEAAGPLVAHDLLGVGTGADLLDLQAKEVDVRRVRVESGRLEIHRNDGRGLGQVADVSVLGPTVGPGLIVTLDDEAEVRNVLVVGPLDGVGMQHGWTDPATYHQSGSPLLHNVTITSAATGLDLRGPDIELASVLLTDVGVPLAGDPPLVQDAVHVDDDPGFVSFGPSLSATELDLSLAPDSPLLGQGRADLLDPATGRADPGSYGGPNAPEGTYEDEDGDGLYDRWEARFSVDDPAADDDGDGLSNAQEFGLGTWPDTADTDGDGTEDGGDSEPLDASRP